MHYDSSNPETLENYNELLLSLHYCSYKFNRIQSPSIPVEDWKKVWGDKVEEFEKRFKSEERR
jgi:hypothetical protein